MVLLLMKLHQDRMVEKLVLMKMPGWVYMLEGKHGHLSHESNERWLVILNT